MVRLADADYAVEDGLFHSVKVGLGCAQTVGQPMLGFPFLHCRHCISYAMLASGMKQGELGRGWSGNKMRGQGRAGEGGRGGRGRLHYPVLSVVELDSIVTTAEPSRQTKETGIMKGTIAFRSASFRAMHNRSCGLCRVLCKGETSSGVYGNIYANIYIYVCQGFILRGIPSPTHRRRTGRGGWKPRQGWHVCVCSKQHDIFLCAL